MNTLPLTSAEMPAPATSLPEHKIGIHFSIPVVPQLVRMAAVNSPVCVVYFARSLEVLLRREGILRGSVGAHGDLGEGLLLFFASDLSRALATVKELLEAWALLNQFVEIAWFDADEQVWRPEPAEASRRFEDWLTPELYDLRTALSASVLSSDAPQQ